MGAAALEDEIPKAVPEALPIFVNGGWEVGEAKTALEALPRFPWFRLTQLVLLFCQERCSFAG